MKSMELAVCCFAHFLHGNNVGVGEIPGYDTPLLVKEHIRS